MNGPSPDERAAMRAFLQRCEVRLSTMHRVATALLSGAGILVLLPAVERDSVLSVLRALLQADVTPATVMLLATVVLSLALAIGVLWLVVLELTRFYFHANHIQYHDGEVFTPRFTLTGLRFPIDELGPEQSADYELLHRQRQNLDLSVPANDRARNKIDRQIDAYPGLRPVPLDDSALASDAARAEALFELAAARRRTLLDEVVKIEFGMTRHVLRLQIIVLRYVKALLIVVATMLATFVTATAVNDPAGLRLSDQRWIAGTMAMWAPTVVIVATAPVRWLEDLLRSEGARRSAVRNDPEYTQVELYTARIALATWLAAVVALGYLFTQPSSRASVAGSIGALVGSLVLSAVAHRRRHRVRED